jgi:hypothetical protein
MRGREARVGDDKSEPKFSEQERREARAQIDAGKERVRTARASAPGDLYALGTAARALVEEPTLFAKLGYAHQKAMLDTELQGILGDSIIRSVLYVRLIDEGGLPKPARCGPDDLVIPVPRVPDGWLSQQTFRRCSFDDLQRALDHLLKQKAPPPPPPAAPKPAEAPPPPAAIAPAPPPKPAAATPALAPPAPAAVPKPSPAPSAAPAPPTAIQPSAPAALARASFPWRYVGLVALLVAAGLILRRCAG